MENPFRYDRLPTDAAFVDRESEIDRIVSCIRGGENLLVHGERRIGKTSCLLRAARRAAAELDATCFFADLSRYSSLADAAEALLRNAVPALSSFGEKTLNWLATTVKGMVLKPTAKASMDASKSGGPDMELSFGVELRAKDKVAHSAAFIEVLDALNKLAGKHHQPVAVILDEFTFLEKIGPDRASWQLRSAIQHHQHLTYILAGSAQHLIDQMHGPDGAFYGMFGRLAVGPIAPDQIAAWIDRSFSKHGLKADDVGASCTQMAGTRTRDIVQLARRAFDLAAGSRTAGAKTVQAAFDTLLDDFEETFHAAWSQLSPAAQAVLTAIAAGFGTRLFSAEARAQFGLGSTAEVSQLCRRLTRTGKNTQDFRDALLVRSQTEAALGHQFDNPFFGAWVGRLQRRIEL